MENTKNKKTKKRLDKKIKKESKFMAAAVGVAKIVEEKQEAYGDSFSKSGKILEILYPDGVKVEQYQDMLTMIRMIDKLFRIATQKDAFGESPFSDLTGYSLLALVASLKEQEEKENGLE